MELLKALHLSVCNWFRKYRENQGISESLSDSKIIDFFQENDFFDDETLNLEISGRDVKQILSILENYERLKADNQYLWDWQTDILQRQQKAASILGDTSLKSRQKKENMALKLFLVKSPKKCKPLLKFEYEQLIAGFFCPETQKHVDPLSRDEAIRQLYEKNNFETCNACYQCLKRLGVKGLPSTYKTDGVYYYK